MIHEVREVRLEVNPDEADAVRRGSGVDSCGPRDRAAEGQPHSALGIDKEVSDARAIVGVVDERRVASERGVLRQRELTGNQVPARFADHRPAGVVHSEAGDVVASQDEPVRAGCGPAEGDRPPLPVEVAGGRIADEYRIAAGSGVDDRATGGLSSVGQFDAVDAAASGDSDAAVGAAAQANEVPVVAAGDADRAGAADRAEVRDHAQRPVGRDGEAVPRGRELRQSNGRRRAGVASHKRERPAEEFVLEFIERGLADEHVVAPRNGGRAAEVVPADFEHVAVCTVVAQVDIEAAATSAVAAEHVGQADVVVAAPGVQIDVEDEVSAAGRHDPVGT